MAEHGDIAALSDDALARQRALTREQVYSRQGQQEEPRAFIDPNTGRTVLLRASEWRLLQIERELAVRAARRDAGSSGPGGPGGHGLGHEQDPRPGTGDVAVAAASARGRADGLRLLRRTAVPFGVGLLVGVAAALTTTGVLRVPELAVFGAGSAEQTPTPSPMADEYRALLNVFSGAERGSHPEARLPAVLEQSFAPDDVAIVFLPANGNTGTRVYAARSGASQLCLIAVIPTQQLAMNCGELGDVARGGLTLHFWLTDGLQQARSLLGDNVDITASMASVSWNPDGTFSITQTPID
ncbi:hypothetical protein ASC66_09685 [Leifsonia sp. Root4]|uniref:hypothetical protein n=1 Tax=Leifsonia sp. Root4 TaxID=1736525 RepID=UPI0006F452D2|nr:hypothetical protein [Leifsonia sp. Root4]KQW06703.1 hypothetical protein ASC66_09685 [Leifsonia sp. Root4]